MSVLLMFVKKMN